VRNCQRCDHTASSFFPLLFSHRQSLTPQGYREEGRRQLWGGISSTLSSSPLLF
jgi:hypothetical protein